MYIRFWFILAVVLSGLVFTFWSISKTTPNERLARVIRWCTPIVAIAAISVIGAMCFTTASATSHGALLKQTLSMDASQFNEAMEHSPEQSPITPEEAVTLADRPKVIYFYKFGCTDCADAYPDAIDYLINNDLEAELLFIPVEGETSKSRQIALASGITEVPQFLCVYPDGTTWIVNPLTDNNEINYRNLDLILSTVKSKATS